MLKWSSDLVRALLTCRRMIEQAKNGAVQAKEQLEVQAKKAGVAVDQSKKQAEPAAKEVQRTVPGTASYFEEQAEHVKKQSM